MVVNKEKKHGSAFENLKQAGLTSKDVFDDDGKEVSTRKAYCPKDGSLEYQGQIGTYIEIQTKNTTANETWATTKQMKNTHWSFVFLSQQFNMTSYSEDRAVDPYQLMTKRINA